MILNDNDGKAKLVMRAIVLQNIVLFDILSIAASLNADGFL